MNITGISKAALLAALFNASKQQGLGFMDLRGAAEMTEVEADEVIAQCGLHFDYLRGRVMKISIDGDTLDPRLYDRDDGAGAAERAIEPLRIAAGVA
jgi:hypothetical protein